MASMTQIDLLSRKRYEARAVVAKALAHPSRLLLLDALAQREMCVCELTDLVGADQSTVSKHLTILRQTGLVEDRREGSMTIYRLKARCLKRMWQCLDQVLRDNLSEQMASLG